MSGIHGHGLAAQFGEEVTWGTQVALTNALRLHSTSLQRQRSKVPVGHLGTYGAANTMHRRHFVESDFAGGELVWGLSYDDSSMLLLKHALGSVSTAGGGAPYTHTFDAASPVPTGLTCAINYGTDRSGAALKNGEVFTGLVIDTLELSLGAGGQVVGKLGCFAQTSTGQAVASSPTFHSGAEEYILHNHFGSTPVSWNGGSFDCLDWTLRTARGMSERQQVGELTSQRPSEVRLTAEMSLTVEWRQDDWYDEWLADTEDDLVLAATGSGGAGPNSMQITLHNAYIAEASKPVSDAGLIRQTVRLIGQADSVNSGLEIEVVNDNITATAN